jgi:23S rRNA (uracil1939-C5)-methyltransferase
MSAARKDPDIRQAAIESLDGEGRGVTRVEGKVIFVEGGLPGERVEFRSYRRKPTYELGEVTAVLAGSTQRVAPRCPHFGVCGGCSMQHLDPRAQVAAKQRTLEENLERIGKVRPGQLLPPIHGPAWGYRHRARLSVRRVAKKGGVLVGFHEKRSSYVAEMRECHVVPARISALIVPLRTLIDGLSVRERLPQVEIAVGDAVDVLVFRILEPLSTADEQCLRDFADAHGVCIYLQPGGPATAFRFHPTEAPALAYSLPEFGVRLPFAPTEFTQVNQQVNAMLVRRALGLLDPRPGERVADFFCGLGNFSLPIARRGANVLGVEGSQALVARAVENARLNGLDDRMEFRVADLFKIDIDAFATLGRFDKVLIDPPRDGAIELVKALEHAPPRRIVYVSCNPATLARDASVLVNALGYRLEAAGIANMFPHTSHVESIALFER